ncbi:MAG: P-loop NTPase fold protein, partial [Syntrophothermus sp.]
MTTKETQNSEIEPAAGAAEDFPGIFKSEGYNSHSALTDPSLDRFGRSILASKIAVAISQRKHKGSIAMGLYGTASSGKTTLLNFIEGEISAAGKARCIRFNPDSYKNEAALTKAFFESLAGADISNSDESARHELAALLTDYSEILTTGIRSLAGNNEEAPVQGNTSEYLSIKDPEVIKEKIGEIFGSADRHIAILIDNLDLLNKSDLKAVFRLLKLYANFPKTIYVLTFDQDSAALKLGRGYDKAAADAGRKFLEKLIQVSINIPPFEKEIIFQEAPKEAAEISPDDLLSILETADAEAISEKVAQASGSIGSDALVNMLIDRSDEISEEGGINLISALGLKGNSFENPDSLFSFTTVFNHPAIVIHDLLKKITENKKRFETASELLVKSEPVSFAFEAYRWMCAADEPEETRLFS